ncbi:hypothetical protein B0G84_4968 [Paraburkholderia sp. BL8N3]|nr:hypothetical protein [Paraburkholderia sp. BL8N3]TCK39628.1 hypothetical protein B0G84_4968 [Paraburkholderia sp. BL8N3]
MDKQFYLVPKELVEALRQYLSQRPWAEVEPAMHALQDLKLHDPKDAK